MRTVGALLQEYSPYSSCHGSSAIAAIASLMASGNSAPRTALLGLLYTPNQSSLIQELLNCLGSSAARDLREACGKSQET